MRFRNLFHIITRKPIENQGKSSFSMAKSIAQMIRTFRTATGGCFIGWCGCGARFSQVILRCFSFSACLKLCSVFGPQTAPNSPLSLVYHLLSSFIMFSHLFSSFTICYHCETQIQRRISCFKASVPELCRSPACVAGPSPALHRWSSGGIDAMKLCRFLLSYLEFS